MDLLYPLPSQSAGRKGHRSRKSSFVSPSRAQSKGGFLGTDQCWLADALRLELLNVDKKLSQFATDRSELLADVLRHARGFETKEPLPHFELRDVETLLSLRGAEDRAHRESVGMEHVLVNGELLIDGGVMREILPGRPIRRSP